MTDKFYLFKCPCCSRLFISSKDEKGAAEISETAARLWIEAKEKFGFPLTAIQSEILKGAI